MVQRISPVPEQVDGILNNLAFKFSVVNGTTANTNIAVSGINTQDRIVSVVKLDFTLAEGGPNTRTWEASDLTSEASITSNGNIQLSTTNTTSEILLVFWIDITA